MARAFTAFVKKECLEHWRTYKILILAIVFVLLGMMNPVTAKITPELLRSLMPKGMNITITEPTVMDSWAQFFKNVPQLGLFVLVILFGGSMANEFSRGTLLNMLTKGLPRRTVLLSKFTVSAGLWTASFWLCFGISYAYTAYFWSMRGVNNLFYSLLCLWLFGVLLLAVLLLFGVLFKNGYGCLLATGAFVVALLLFYVAPALQNYNPYALASENMALLTGQKQAAALLPAVLICLGGIAASLTGAVALFNKKQL